MAKSPPEDPRSAETRSLVQSESGEAAERPAAERTRIGRYTVLGEVGAGGMGVVYRAHDPELDREVALKLVRIDQHKPSDSDSESRLVREAQAMAQLSHPNVVPVFDVGLIDAELFIAMEYVRGQTLRRWLGDGRSRREVLDAFRQAGRGLAAAHARGIVHRDFKPTNVMVGDDGRVRVMDFGLARAEGQDSSSETPGASPAGASSSSNRLLGSPLTEAGVVMGTPSYMAPEQHAGHPADPASDQYSFCVALFEAVYGTRPFEAANETELVSQKLAGQIRELDARARRPLWLSAAIRRGLAPRPSQRWPSMDALVGQLDRDARSSRPLAVAAVAAIVAAAAIGYQTDRESAGACVDPRTQLLGVWDPARSESLRSALVATGAPYAEDAAAEVGSRLDVYAEEWVEAHTAVCGQGETRDAVTLDRQFACLRGRLAELRGLVDVLASADRAIAEKAVVASSALSSAARCADPELVGRIDLPADPNDAARIEALRARLAQATSLVDVGKSDPAIAIAEEVLAAAGDLDYEPLHAEATALIGEAHSQAGRYPAAERAYSDAYFVALAAKHDEVASKSALLLAYLLAARLNRADEAETWLQRGRVALDPGFSDPLIASRLAQVEAEVLEQTGHSHAALARLHDGIAELEAALGPDHPALYRMLAATVSVLTELDELEESDRTHRRLLALSERTFSPRHPSMAVVLHNLGYSLDRRGRYSDALSHYQRSMAIADASLGLDHPVQGQIRMSIGTVHLREGEDAEAIAHFRSALPYLERAYGPSNTIVGRCLANMATSHMGLRKLEDSLSLYQRAYVIFEDALGPEHPDVGAAHNNMAGILAQLGRGDESLSHSRQAVAIATKSRGPGHVDVALALANWAATLAERGHHAEARTLLERIVAIHEARHGDPFLLASKRFDLAKALWESGGDRRRAVTLARQARETFAPADDRELPAVERWLEAHASL